MKFKLYWYVELPDPLPFFMGIDFRSNVPFFEFRLPKTIDIFKLGVLRIWPFSIHYASGSIALTEIGYKEINKR